MVPHVTGEKIMSKKNLKIQMLAGNRLKSCVSAGSEISTTLVFNFVNLFINRKAHATDALYLILRHIERIFWMGKQMFL